MIKTFKILILFIFPLIGYTQTWDLVWSDEFDSNVFESKIDIFNLNKGVYFLQGRNKINNRTIKILKI
tara:strand:- start:259 stop:462 length:204 start_codon:yes stop_codon:yes gene_type:complete